jgi:hypothetical protein
MIRNAALPAAQSDTHQFLSIDGLLRVRFRLLVNGVLPVALLYGGRRSIMGPFALVRTAAGAAGDLWTLAGTPLRDGRRWLRMRLTGGGVASAGVPAISSMNSPAGFVGRQSELRILRERFSAAAMGIRRWFTWRVTPGEANRLCFPSSWVRCRTRPCSRPVVMRQRHSSRTGLSISCSRGRDGAGDGPDGCRGPAAGSARPAASRGSGRRAGH